MSIGPSGRIVLEVEKDVKRELYSALSRDGMTLKDWFLKNALSYIADRTQMSLSLVSSEEKVQENASNSNRNNGT